jgi:hypothetical protein
MSPPADSLQKECSMLIIIIMIITIRSVHKTERHSEAMISVQPSATFNLRKAWAHLHEL